MERGSRGDARTLKEPEEYPHPLRRVILKIAAEYGIADVVGGFVQGDRRVLLIGPEAD